jgi:peroxiredoxin
LADYQKKIAKIHDRDASVVALSADAAPDAEKTVNELELTIPIGYALDPEKVAETIGAYVNQDPPHLQPASFILEPGGTVALAVYSTGAVGRLHADEAIDELEFFQEQKS